MIGGNVTATLEEKETHKNQIGETVAQWIPKDVFIGFLDFVSGESKYDTYNAKVEESTHVFVMDYKAIDKKESNKRLVIDGMTYEVTLIDDPMNLHEHIEIYLKYTGD